MSSVRQQAEGLGYTVRRRPDGSGHDVITDDNLQIPVEDLLRAYRHSMLDSGPAQQPTAKPSSPGTYKVAIRAEKAIDDLLHALGEDTEDENLVNTPMRAAAFFLEFMAPAGESPKGILSPSFGEKYKSLVMVKDITFVSLCAHHLLPFRGRATVGYIPGTDGKIVGLSKLARLVHFHAKRITLQERITDQIVDSLVAVLKCRGAMVVLKSEHQCMSIRGVTEPEAITVTSAVRGVFLENKQGSKDEFLRLMEETL